MVKRVIYSYKILHEYWKEKNKLFFSLAKLSVSLAKQHYTTVLYCDKGTELAFKKNGIEFDEVIYLPSLVDVSVDNYGLAKILAMQEQTEPYLIIDLDTLIFEPIISNQTITFGYKEADPSKEWGLKYIKEYYLDPFQNFKDRINFKIDWSIFPNNSLVLVNNPILVSEIYKKILDIINGDYTLSTVQLYEQKFLYDFLKSYKVDIGFLYDNPPIVEKESSYTLLDVLSKKFVHLDFYHRQDSCKNLIEKLEKKVSKVVG